MREKSRDSSSPKPWRSRQAILAPDITPSQTIVQCPYCDSITSASELRDPRRPSGICAQQLYPISRAL